ncbi:MAG: hypothetical protein J6K61_04675, partial [Clostridia bacterium]|nr:hypothetical protein [Clostridia bacterium]
LEKMKRVCDMQAYVLPQALSHAEKIGVSTEENPIISEETPVISEETRGKEKEKITTTTTISFNKESGKEKNAQNPVPDLFEVRTYFRKLGFSETEAVIEAARFLAYNAARGWEGLLKAEWQALAQLWAERKDERDGI